MASTASPTTDTGLARLGQVSLLVRDIGRAERFYGEVLGLPHLFTFGDLAFFDLAGTRLYLQAVRDTEWRPGSILYLDVADIGAARARLLERGVAFEDEPRLIHRHPDGIEEWMSFFRDPDANQLALMSRVPPA